MRVIIIGAGRGSRLMPTTEDSPKCFAEVGDRRILDWTLDAFRSSGVDDICFVGGYCMDTVEGEYPELTFRFNDKWPHNNVLASLFYAEDLMDGPFVCCYSDILFSPQVISALLEKTDDMTLVVDTKWSARYAHRTQHPPDDAEKVIVRQGQVTRISREIATEEAYGEYIGVAKFSAAGARCLREHYHRLRNMYSGLPFRDAAVFEKAYKIHLFQEMLEAGESFSHLDTDGEYIEIDTQEDFDYARKHWTTKHLVVNHG